MKGLAVLLLAAVAYGIPQGEELKNEWTSYKSNHGKAYNPREDEMRFMNFVKALQFVEDHNAKFAAGEVTFDVEMNRFADWTPQEYAHRNGLIRTNSSEQGVKLINPLGNPSSVNWVDKGYVTPVKDQGQCGSCWAFGTTGATEGQLFRNTKKLVSLSESELVDCDTAGNSGCNGGFQERAFAYIKTHGLTSEAAYPYHPRRGSCQHKTPVVHITGFTKVHSKDESALETAVASVGPVTISIDASHMSFQLYKSGVYIEPRCSSTRLDHAVLAVGYGTESGKNYWLVKNSWGRSWGEAGYIKMAKNHNNQCGVATDGSYPNGVKA